jgi:nucleoside-diphosphate-sugar epimerase
MKILIIGGTRQVGYFLTERLLREGHQVTLLNRGISRDDLPDSLPRLRCDRTDPVQLKRALSSRNFDMVIDNVLYREPEARTIVELLDGRVGHYITLSSGQVYLVREGLSRPFIENDYAGATIPAPAFNTYDYEEWLYGMDKRACEDVLTEAHRARNFPSTILRLPMVSSARDQFQRLYSYLLRLKDGGPILVPDTPDYPLRHVYAQDVVTALMHLITTGEGKGEAFNISQDETLPLSDYLGVVADILSVTPKLIRVPRQTLIANGFLPDCSPFSDVWMSELDNAKSKQQLNMSYTPLPEYLSAIIEEYQQRPPVHANAGYSRRNSERTFAATFA